MIRESTDVSKGFSHDFIDYPRDFREVIEYKALSETEIDVMRKNISRFLSSESHAARRHGHPLMSITDIF